ncbi:O-antigen ligase family protein [Vibrio cincinnatiensis]
MITKHNTFYQNMISLVICSFPILCLAFGKGYNYPALILAIGSVLTVPFWCNKNTFTRPAVIISLSFFIYFFSHLLSWLIDGGDISNLDQVSRFVFVIPILFMLIRLPLKKQHFFYALALGAIIAGIVSIIHVYQLGFSRAFTGENSHWWLNGYMPIQSGNMAMSLGFLSLTLSFYSLKTRQWILFSFSLVGFFSGILASFLSGSRGAWIAVPFVMLYLLWRNKDLLNKKRIIIISTVFLVSILGIYSIDNVQNRVLTGIKDIQQYEQENKYSSLGIRLELWKNAWLTFKESPLIGVGEVERYTIQKRFGDQGLIDYKVAHKFFSHAHNQYLDDLSIRGIIGFIALLVLFITPIMLSSSRYLNIITMEHQLLQQLMVVHILLFSFYQMTQAMFSHNSGTIFFSLMTMSIFSLINRAISQQPLTEKAPFDRSFKSDHT